MTSWLAAATLGLILVMMELPMVQMSAQMREAATDELMSEVEEASTATSPANIIRGDIDAQEQGHKPGGLPMMSDSVFSLVILIYVSLAFLLVFFLFCWKTSGSEGIVNGKRQAKLQCPLMTSSQFQPILGSPVTLRSPNHELIALTDPRIIPPTPTTSNYEQTSQMV